MEEIYIVIEQCGNCEKKFDLAYDLEITRGEDCSEPIKSALEACGVKDLLCWECRCCSKFC